MVRRIPRKKGQPAKSKKHSDLYTDEDPKGTIHGLKFATVADAQRSIRKIKNSTSVFWLNLFLGWTIVGYFVLLFYAALTSVTKEVSVTEFLKGKSKKKE